MGEVLSMRLHYKEVIFIKYLCSSLGIRLEINIRGKIGIPIIMESGLMTYRNSDNDNIKLVLDSKGSVVLEEDVLQNIYNVSSEYENSSYIDSCYWAKNIGFNVIGVSTEDGNDFKNKNEFMRWLFKKYLEVNKCTSADLVYESSGLTYSCKLFISMEIISQYRIVDTNGKESKRRINVYTDDLDFLLNIKKTVNIIGIYKNLESPTKQAVYNQLKRLRSDKNSVKIYTK